MWLIEIFLFGPNVIISAKLLILSIKMMISEKAQTGRAITPYLKTVLKPNSLVHGCTAAQRTFQFIFILTTYELITCVSHSLLLYPFNRRQ